jgi:hypothetical protein
VIGRSLAGTLLFLACAPSNPKTEAEKGSASSAADSIVLERTICYGTCPAYRLRLSDGGAIRFESRNPGDEGRIAEDTAAPATLASLVSRARAIDFFDLPPEIAADPTLCQNRATDHSTVVLTIFTKTEATRVQDYLGCFETTQRGVQPRVVRLRSFEAEVDSVLQSSRWTQPASRR